MDVLWVQGVVKNGQVVLDPPLDLPDGTILTVTRYDPDDDPRPQRAKIDMTPEEFAEFTELFTRKKDPALWAEFEARIKEKYGPWLPHHFPSAG